MALPDSPEINASHYIDEEEFIAVVVPDNLAGERLDKVLAQLIPQHSRNRLQSWIEGGFVTLAGLPLKIRYSVNAGDQIMVIPQASAEEQAYLPENISLDVVYEDEDILVIHKPAGMVVHPAAGNWSGTVLNALLHHYPSIAAVPRAGIVHRLDKDTSGLLMIAKTLEAQTDLVRQLQSRQVIRRYLAFAWGQVKSQTVHASLGRDPRDRLKMALLTGSASKPAVTHVHQLETVDFQKTKISLVMCRLETGRTHQIRVHLESLGNPLVGDPVYKKKLPTDASSLSFERPGQALHAAVLGIEHPRTKESIIWKAPLPSDMQQLGENLGFSASCLCPNWESFDV
ncbi:MAG: RluA family pseudouridine synthase [Polynucleobacter victoriensis]